MSVKAEGEEVATEGNGYEGLAKVSMIKVGKPVLPSTNRAQPMAHKMASPPGKTTYKGAKIWVTRDKVTRSMNEPGIQGIGDKSGKPAGAGPAKASALVQAVYVEGSKVVRHLDPTDQDDGNCEGQVLTKAEADAAAAAAAADRAAGALALLKGPRAPKKTDGQGAPSQGAATTTQAGTSGTGEEKAVTDCQLLSAKLGCQHGREPGGGTDPRDSGLLLEVVPEESDRIQMMAKVNNPHGEEHPVWTCRGAEEFEYKAAVPSFNVEGWSRLGGAALGAAAFGGAAAAGAGQGIGALATLGAVLALATVAPKRYEISVEACKGTPRKFLIKSYPSTELSAEMNFQWLAEAAKCFGEGLKILTGKAELGMKVLVGHAGVKAKWKEVPKYHRAYCQTTFEFGFDPAWALVCDIDIPLPPPAEIVKRGIELLHLGELSFYISFELGFSVKGLLIKQWKGWSGGGKFGAKFEIGIGVKAAISDAVSLKAGIAGEATVTVSIEGKGDEPEPKQSTEATIGEVKGQIIVEVELGWLKTFGGSNYEKKWEVVFFEGFKIPISKDQPI